MKKKRKLSKVLDKKNLAMKQTIKEEGVFIKSLRKIRVSIFKIIFLDFLSNLIIFSLILLFWKLLSAKVEAVTLPNSIFELTQLQLAALSAQIESSFYYVVFLITIFPLLITILWSVSRALLWKISLDDKISIKYLLKSIPLGMIWFGLGMIPAMLFMLTLQEGINILFVLVYLVIFIYLSNILFINYAVHERIKIFRETLKSSIARIPDMGLAFLFILIGYFILSKFILTPFMNYTGAVGMIVSIIVYMFYFAWARFLLIEVYNKKIEER